MTLAASDGTTIELQPRSDLKLLRADAERWMRLGSGAVSVHVAKLTTGERFVILTPDAEVEVRGTRFPRRARSTGRRLRPRNTDPRRGRRRCRRGSLSRRKGDPRPRSGRELASGLRAVEGCTVVLTLDAAAVSDEAPVAGRAVDESRGRDGDGRPPGGRPPRLWRRRTIFSAPALKAERSGDRRTAAHLLADHSSPGSRKSPLRESAERESARLTGARSNLALM